MSGELLVCNSTNSERSTSRPAVFTIDDSRSVLDRRGQGAGSSVYRSDLARDTRPFVSSRDEDCRRSKVVKRIISDNAPMAKVTFPPGTRTVESAYHALDNHAANSAGTGPGAVLDRLCHIITDRFRSDGADDDDRVDSSDPTSARKPDGDKPKRADGSGPNGKKPRTHKGFTRFQSRAKCIADRIGNPQEGFKCITRLQRKVGSRSIASAVAGMVMARFTNRESYIMTETRSTSRQGVADLYHSYLAIRDGQATTDEFIHLAKCMFTTVTMKVENIPAPSVSDGADEYWFEVFSEAGLQPPVREDSYDKIFNPVTYHTTVSITGETHTHTIQLSHKLHSLRCPYCYQATAQEYYSPPNGVL